MSTKKNAIYAQSGGVTAVINASAAGVVAAYLNNTDKIDKLYAAQNGVLGILHENLIDLSNFTKEDIANLKATPGGTFGSCRYKLKDLDESYKDYKRIIEVFKAHNIAYLLYNGGNDSADTCLKIAKFSKELDYPITAIHIPKTIDNDLTVTDNCPGFGSVAKYVATSIMEAGFDLESMYNSSTKVFIMEVMGRHAGWIAAASGLASIDNTMPPHIILFPEIVFNETMFLQKVSSVIQTYGYCVIVVSEGIKNAFGELISKSDFTDAFGHETLGGVASFISSLITNNLSLKCHYAICDYLQRSARHIASKVDVEQAYKLAYRALELALEGYNSVMPYIKRVASNPYEWVIDVTILENVANYEKKLPQGFITQDGYHITQQCKEYLKPLINGEAEIEYQDGLPKYTKFAHTHIVKKLPIYEYNLRV